MTTGATVITEQEPSRGYKFSILENVLPFGTASCWGVPVGATPLHLLSQTALPLKSPTGAFIAPLRFANAVLPQTLLYNIDYDRSTTDL